MDVSFTAYLRDVLYKLNTSILLHYQRDKLHYLRMINRRIFHEVYLPQSPCQIKRRNLKAKYINIDKVV